MTIYKVKLIYDSRHAAGFDDETTITVHGDLEDLQKAALEFYRALGIQEHERYGSFEIQRNEEGTNLQISMDGSIANFSNNEIIVAAPGQGDEEAPQFK
jgi:hypothetical protein